MVSTPYFSLPVAPEPHQNIPLPTPGNARKRKRASEGTPTRPELSGLDAPPSVTTSEVLQHPVSPAYSHKESAVNVQVSSPSHLPRITNCLSVDTRQGSTGRDTPNDSPSHAAADKSLSPIVPIKLAAKGENSSVDLSQQQSLLRARHLSVLTTVLHRSLLEGDYQRASRVWGILLRMEYRGSAVSIRSGGRWSIGAEILLSRDVRPIQSSERGPGGLETLGAIGSSQHLASIAGSDLPLQSFKLARDYYDRLILQFPFSKWQPNAINALDFYPALMGLWLRAIQQRKLAVNYTSDKPEGSSSSRNSEGSNPDLYLSDRDGSDPEALNELAEVERKAELQEAEQIATRLDELLLSPPYSDSPHLWKLRGMISLWLGDLYVPGPSGRSTLPKQRTNESPVQADSNARMRRLVAEIDHQNDLKRQSKELLRARDAFNRCRATGGFVRDEIWAQVECSGDGPSKL